MSVRLLLSPSPGRLKYTLATFFLLISAATGGRASSAMKPPAKW
jgi:hypothetical protein